MDGRLNLAAMGLKEVPDDVLTMYKYDPDDTTISWGEVVDLTAFIAPDNELETLPDTMFPDVDFEEISDPDEGGPQFGGLQNVDLHGNVLRGLPVGLGRLTQLSKLNLVSVQYLFGVLSQTSNIGKGSRFLRHRGYTLHGKHTQISMTLTCTAFRPSRFTLSSEELPYFPLSF